LCFTGGWQAGYALIIQVFPGGTFDLAQDQSFAITAVRETFEETGLLLARGSQSTPSLTKLQLDQAREQIHNHQLSFREFLNNAGLQTDVDSLLPFSQWITPQTSLRRFHVHFYLHLPNSSAPSDGDTQPEGDGGIEIVSAKFIRPQDVLSQHRAGKVLLMPPQFYLLSLLDRILSGLELTASQTAVLRNLSQSFGRRIFSPQFIGKPDESGRGVLAYEGDEERGGKPGARHRSTVKIEKGGVCMISTPFPLEV
jgi:8-oxo-dGTP pyrophosphatase MutT (NUDIX family)